MVKFSARGLAALNQAGCVRAEPRLLPECGLARPLDRGARWTLHSSTVSRERQGLRHQNAEHRVWHLRPQGVRLGEQTDREQTDSSVLSFLSP